MHCASRNIKGEKQQQQTPDGFLHFSPDEFISHEFPPAFFKNRKIKQKLDFRSFCSDKETSVCFRRPPQESKCYIFRPSSITVRLLQIFIYIYILHFPACPCSHTHKDTLLLHQRRWRDEMKRREKSARPHGVAVSPETKSVTKNSAPAGKRPFLIGSFLFCAEHSFFILQQNEYLEKKMMRLLPLA